MSSRDAIWVLGTMSGTSLDGVDAAMVRTDGHTVFDFARHGYRAYSAAERDVIRTAFGQTDGTQVQAAAEVVEIAHVELIQTFPEAELIGFHGQTVLHLPAQQKTVQVGDGRVLAKALDRPVVWDFRSADMVLGGQGAPLAPFYHFALAKRLGFDRPVAFLNLGGVGNLTWLDPTANAPETPGACLAFDTGPANALINDLCQSALNQPMDKGGALAARGTVDTDVLTRMMAAEYFRKSPPKSLDRNDFSQWSDLVSKLGTADAIATLAAGTVEAVAQSLTHCPTAPSRVLVAGGGRHNGHIMRRLAETLPCPVTDVDDHNLNGDMLEAEAFAYLAARVLYGQPTSAPGTTGVAAPVGGGQISRP